jgi:predicted Zn-dependent peptidase
VIEHQLANGLRVVIQPEAAVPLVTLDMWVRVGAGDEPRDLAGISHFLEHMLFKGTDRLPTGEYDRRIEGAGGYLNAATSMDWTHYYITFPADQFERVLPDFADVIMNSRIDPAEVERERQVILEEISRKLDNPMGFLFDEAIPGMFESGPYGHPVIGYRDSVARMTRDELAEHYERYYTADNMFLCITGAVDPAAVIDRVAEAFAPLRPARRPWHAAPPPTVYTAPQDRILPREWKEAYFIMAFPAPRPAGPADVAVAEVAEAVLAGGRSARLVRILQEELGLVSTIGAYFMTNRHDAPLMVYGTAKPENVQRARAEIIRQLEALRADGPTADELRRARRVALNGHLFATETNAARASVLGQSHVLFDSPVLLTHHEATLRAVSGRDVGRYLAAHLDTNAASFFLTQGR